MRTRAVATRSRGLLLAATVSGAAAELPVQGAAPGEKPTLAPPIRQVTPAVVSIYVE